MFHYLRCILVTFCVMSYVGCTSIDAIPPPPLAHVMNCGSTDEMVGECSNDLPEHLIDFLQNFRIDISKEDILTKCELFNGPIYCLPKHKQNSLNYYVDGAQLFLRKFCSDEDFQKRNANYLRHKECFFKIQSYWIGCTIEFKETLADDGVDDNGVSMRHKFIECFCARYSFVNCIHNNARLKCNQESAAYLRKAARILTAHCLAEEHPDEVGNGVHTAYHAALRQPVSLPTGSFCVEPE